MKYYPDKWCLFAVETPDGPIYKVLASFYGGYAAGDSWKTNSGCVSVQDTGSHFIFRGASGSEYHCHKNSYGTSMYVSTAVGRHVNVLPEDTDFMNLDYSKC